MAQTNILDQKQGTIEIEFQAQTDLADLHQLLAEYLDFLSTPQRPNPKYGQDYYIDAISHLLSKVDNELDKNLPRSIEPNTTPEAIDHLLKNVAAVLNPNQETKEEEKGEVKPEKSELELPEHTESANTPRVDKTNQTTVPQGLQKENTTPNQPTSVLKRLLKQQREFIEVQTKINQAAIALAANIQEVSGPTLERYTHNSPGIGNKSTTQIAQVATQVFAKELPHITELNQDTTAQLTHRALKALQTHSSLTPGQQQIIKEIAATKIQALSSKTTQTLESNHPSLFQKSPITQLTPAQTALLATPKSAQLTTLVAEKLRGGGVNPEIAAVEAPKIITTLELHGLNKTEFSPDTLRATLAGSSTNTQIKQALSSLSSDESNILINFSQNYVSNQLESDVLTAAIDPQTKQKLIEALDTHPPINGPTPSQVVLTHYSLLKEQAIQSIPTPQSLNQLLSHYGFADTSDDANQALSNALANTDINSAKKLFNLLTDINHQNLTTQQFEEILKLSGDNKLTDLFSRFINHIQSDSPETFNAVNPSNLLEKFRSFLGPDNAFTPNIPQGNTNFPSSARAFISELPTNLRGLITNPRAFFSNLGSNLSTFFKRIDFGNLFSKASNIFSNLGSKIGPGASKLLSRLGQTIGPMLRAAGQAAAAAGKAALAAGRAAIAAIPQILAFLGATWEIWVPILIVGILVVSLIQHQSRTSPGGIARSQQVTIPSDGGGGLIEDNPFLSAQKTSSPTQLSDPAGNLTYTYSLTPRQGAVTNLTIESDEVVVYQQSGSRSFDISSPPTPPSELNTSWTSPGFDFALDNSMDDAAIINTITLNFTAPDGSSQSVRAIATTIVGTPPTGCFVFAGPPAPHGSLSVVPWSQYPTELAKETAAASTIMSSFSNPSATSLCSGGPVNVYLASSGVSVNYGGWFLGNGNIALDFKNGSVGSHSNALYTLAHEAGHAYDSATGISATAFRQAGFVSSTGNECSGNIYPFPKLLNYESECYSENFAEGFALYIHPGARPGVLPESWRAWFAANVFGR